jgi:hypothetical protein
MFNVNDVEQQQSPKGNDYNSPNTFDYASKKADLNYDEFDVILVAQKGPQASLSSGPSPNKGKPASLSFASRVEEETRKSNVFNGSKNMFKQTYSPFDQQ